MGALENFVAAFQSEGWKSQPFNRMLDIVRAGQAHEFVISTMTRLAGSHTFLDAALSYLTPDEFADAIDLAVDLLRQQPRDTRAPENVIAYASLQVVDRLHPHLPALWDLDPNGTAYYEMWPWRAAPDTAAERLAQNFDADPLTSTGFRAWEGLVETRTERGLALARERASTAPLEQFRGSSARADHWYRMVGLKLRDGRFEPLHSKSTFHLVFDPSYFEQDLPAHRRRENHPTWFDLQTPSLRANFGGLAASSCLNCHSRLHRMLALDPVPPGLPITTRRSVEFATCLTCLGFAVPTMFFEHDNQGGASPATEGSSSAAPEFWAEPFPETQVDLAPTPDRWQRQDWALSNSRENLNRLGGEPAWIQNADYPNCITCGRTMTFVLQLDSDLPVGEIGRGEWMWGSGGIAYFFWCDSCAISAALWQCT